MGWCARRAICKKQTEGISLNYRIALAAVVVLSGCASTPRYEVSQLDRMSDSQICLTARQTENGHPDSPRIWAEYERRVEANRFTRTQCKQHFDYVVAQKSKANSEAFGRALEGIFGAAAEAYAANPRGQRTPPAAYTLPSPSTPQGMLRLFESETTIGTNRYCRYNGGIIITVSNLTFCPNSIRQ
jgi:hypothetical protein